MRRGFVVAIGIVLLSSGCAGGRIGAQTVRVDFSHDEFASHYWRYFPRTVYAHPGDEIVFDQQWTGEPHTVTFGTIVDESLPRIDALEAKFGAAEPETEAELEAAMEQYEESSAELPIFAAYHEADDTNAVLPCYLESGVPPQGMRADLSGSRAPGKPCPQRAQPEFDGTQSYYSSGFIAPEGPSGNTYRLPLSDDIAPGSYRFYCVIHFPEMQGRLVVEPPDAPLPDPSDVNETAQREIEELAGPLRRAFDEARAGRARDPNGEAIRPPIAGYHAGEEFTVAVDEFVPKVWRTKVGEPVTWTITGAHTVSFDVPPYLPIYLTTEDGSVVRNPVVDRAAGGSPEAPPVDFVKQGPRLDGGTWDGEGFISSGLLGGEPVSTYTLRVSKPGRYRYACLVHPPMVATLVVEE